MTGSNRKVKSAIHWVSVQHALAAEVRLYDRLFNVENPADEKEKELSDLLNPDSLQILPDCFVEEELKTAQPYDHFQFQRIGYFNVDPDSKTGKLIFNRTVSLKDTWSKIMIK